MPYGHGNGGGGPTREMIERARRLADLDGAAAAARSARPTTSSTHVEAEVAAGAPVPVWDGELYFEMHRGTLTSQVGDEGGQPALRAPAARGRAVVGVGRRGARRTVGGRARRAVEGRAAPAVPRHHPRLVDRLGARRQPRPRTPGSPSAWRRSIARGAGAARARRPGRRQRRDARPRTRGRCGRIEPPRRRRADAGARTTARSRCVVAVARRAASAPLRRSTVRRRAWSSPSTRSPTVTSRSAGTSTATITSIIDVTAGRELLPPGAAVALELAPDHPVEYDAWDVEAWTRGLGRAVGGVRVGRGRRRRSAGRRRCEVVRRFGRVVDHRSGPRCAPAARASTSTFDIDWHEDEQLLSLMVPLDVHARRGRVRHPVRPRDAPDARRARRGTRPSSRCARTASSTSPSRRSVSPCSTTVATATVCRTAASACRCCARRSTPTRRRTTAGTGSRSACCRTAPGLHEVLPRGRGAEHAAARRGAGRRRPASPPPLVTVDGARRGGQRGQARRRRQRRPDRAPRTRCAATAPPITVRAAVAHHRRAALQPAGGAAAALESPTASSPSPCARSSSSPCASPAARLRTR